MFFCFFVFCFFCFFVFFFVLFCFVLFCFFLFCDLNSKKTYKNDKLLDSLSGKQLFIISESTTPVSSCNCNGDSKVCADRTCLCGQGYECSEGQCTGTLLQLSIVSPAPHYPGSSGDLPGDLQNIVSPQTQDLPLTYAGRYFLQKGQKLLPRDVTTQRCPHMRELGSKAPGVMSRGFTRKKSQSTKLNLWASLRYPRVVGAQG